MENKCSTCIINVVCERYKKGKKLGNRVHSCKYHITKNDVGLEVWYRIRGDK